jgi:fructose-1,6-bisphosphatase/inositol monophosphatase family enzyme
MTDVELLDAVRELAVVGGSEALQFFRGQLKPELKSDGSIVTIADRRTETVMREWIRARFPDDGILGEEHGEERRGAERRWIIDPIDGTASFARGSPEWGTLVAVARGDTVLAGAINCAALSELVCAATGGGCWFNGSRARVSNVRAISRARAGLNDCHGYLLVATGRAEVMLDPRMAAWDSAALQPIITEAGGVFTDWEGRATAFGGSAIATNAALAVKVRALLTGASA